MLQRITYLGLTACLMLLVTTAATPSPQEATEKRPKDQMEYDLISCAFGADKQPPERLKCLDEWKEKYPETAYEEERTRVYMQMYQATGDNANAVKIAQQILEDQPRDFASHYLITTIVPRTQDASPEMKKAAVDSAKVLIAKEVDRPDGVQDAQWDQAIESVQLPSQYVVLTHVLENGSDGEKEDQIETYLEIDPKNAGVTYQLAQLVLAKRDPNLNATAMWLFARAAGMEGEGALPPEAKKQATDYITKLYGDYTGAPEEVPEFMERAQASLYPPDGFKIKSKAVREFEDEQKDREANPDVWIYRDLKSSLLSQNGDEIWSDLKGKITPEMALYVVSASPADRPTRVNLSPTPNGETEVVLGLANRRRSGLAKGTKLKVEGVASTLSKEPFKLTLTGGQILGR